MTAPTIPEPSVPDLRRARLLADRLPSLRAAGDRAARAAGEIVDALRGATGEPLSDDEVGELAGLLTDAAVISRLVRSGAADAAERATADRFRRENPGPAREIDRAAGAVAATGRMTYLAAQLTGPGHEAARRARAAELTGRRDEGRLSVSALFGPATASDVRSAALARAAAHAFALQAAEVETLIRHHDDEQGPHAADRALAGCLVGLAAIPGASGAPTVWPMDPTLLTWLRKHTVSAVYTWDFEELAARRWVGGDLYGTRALPAVPAFLAATDTRSLPAHLIAPLLRRISLTQAAPTEADLTKESLASDPGPVTTVPRSPSDRHWGRPPDPLTPTPLLPAETTIPHLLHGIWLGPPLPATSTFWTNYATAADRYHGQIDVILWTDIPRADIHHHPELLTWARQHHIQLINIHEIFHATAPMTLHTPYTLETTKHLPRGYAAASDHLRIDIINRFGGIYADGDLRFGETPEVQVTSGPHPDYPTWLGDWPVDAWVALDDGPRNLPELIAGVAGSKPGFTLNAMGDQIVSNDVVVAPAGHPAIRLWLECARLNYYRAQADLFGGVTALVNGTEPERELRGGRPSAWNWAVTPARSGRTHHLLLRTLALPPRELSPVRPAIWPSNELSWLPPGAGEPVVTSADDDVAVLRRCIAYLRWQVLTRGGDLHLSGIAPHVRGLRDPDAGWTALLLALPTLGVDLPPITSVTDLRRNADGSLDQVVLPARAEALLDRTATPPGWLGRGHGNDRELWLLDERVTPVALRAAQRTVNDFVSVAAELSPA